MPHGALSSSICCSSAYGIGVTKSNSGGNVSRIGCDDRGVLLRRPPTDDGEDVARREVELLGHERRRRRVERRRSAPVVVGQRARSNSRTKRNASAPWSTLQKNSPRFTIGPTVVQRELELGDDAEVAAAAAQRPVQVGVLGRRRGHDAAVGGDDLRRHEVVAAQPRLVAEASRCRRRASGRRRRCG